MEVVPARIAINVKHFAAEIQPLVQARFQSLRYQLVRAHPAGGHHSALVSHVPGDVEAPAFQDFGYGHKIHPELGVGATAALEGVNAGVPVHERGNQVPRHQLPQQDAPFFLLTQALGAWIAVNLFPESLHASSELGEFHPGLEVETQCHARPVHHSFHRFAAHPEAQRSLDATVRKIQVAEIRISLRALNQQAQAHVLELDPAKLLPALAQRQGTVDMQGVSVAPRPERGTRPERSTSGGGG